MDRIIADWFANLVFRWPALDQLGIFFADTLAYVIVIAALAYALANARTRWPIIKAFIVAGIARFGITTLIRLFIERPRPFVELDILPLIEKDIGEFFNSFPSGHAVFYFALAASLYKHNRAWGIGLFVAATLMGIGRMYVGVHWFSDIIGGAVIGIATVWVFDKVVRK